MSTEKKGKKMIYEIILEELNREKLWFYGKDISENSKDIITLKDFRKILMFGKITDQERKVRELWKLMEDLDFFSKVNQSKSMFVHLGVVAKVLGYETLPSSTLLQSDNRSEEQQATSTSAGD